MPRPRPLQMAKNPSELPAMIDDVTPIVEFIHAFQEISDPRAQQPSKLISIKMPVPLLAAFKFRSALAGVPYQTMIKRLMVEYLRHH